MGSGTEVTKTAFVFAQWVLVAAIASTLTSGCNFIIEADRKQCTKDDDCTKRGPAFAGTVCVNSMCEPAPPPVDPLWACLDEAPAPAQPRPYTVTVHAQNIANMRPVIDAEVKLCRKLDPECTGPERETRTDGNGDAVLEIPDNVTTAYFSIKKFDATDPNEQWVPAYYYFNPNINSSMNVSVQMATQTLRNQLIFVLQVPQEPTRGLMLINALNCQGTAAQGIVFKADKADEATTTFYVVSGLPNITQTSTNTDGYGGFINIPVGTTGKGDTVTVIAEVEATGRVMNTNALHVRPDAITYSRMVPIGQPPSP
jgi:hypothetical protein